MKCDGDLLPRPKSEFLEEGEVIGAQIGAVVFQEAVLFVRQGDVAELCLFVLVSELLSPRPTMVLTCNLLLQPVVAGSGEPLLGRAVCEGVGDGDILEVLEDGALHRQFVEVGVEEGNDALWVGRRAVEIHVVRFRPASPV